MGKNRGKTLDNFTVSANLHLWFSISSGISGNGKLMGMRGRPMTPEEILAEVQKFIDRSFAEGKQLEDVLRDMKGYIESLGGSAG